VCTSGQAVIAGCNLRTVHFSATSLAGCNHAVGCSNCQLFELCFLFLIKHFLLGVGYIVILSKWLNVAKMSKHIFKRLTLAQCVDVQCRPTVVGCRPLHSVYLHTPLMCIVPWQSGAYALKQSALYKEIYFGGNSGLTQKFKSKQLCITTPLVTNKPETRLNLNCTFELTNRAPHVFSQHDTEKQHQTPEELRPIITV